MAANKVIALRSGGTLILTMDSVNLFDADESERQLIDGISAAIRAYERKTESDERTKQAAQAKAPDARKDSQEKA